MIWYVFPSPEIVGSNSISWEGHLAGLITGFVFAIKFKTPDYIKEIKYEWEKPDFNPEEDAFMKHFDENGNFVATPEPEIIEETIPLAINYFYTLKENKSLDDKISE